MLRSILASIVAVFIAVSASASTFTFNTSDSQFDPGVDNQGWWPGTSAQAAIDANDNYFTGQSLVELRSFFTFDLSGLDLDGKTPTSATLELRRGFQTADVTLGFFQVSTNAATLNNNVGYNGAIFADLGDGPSYGTFSVPNGNMEDVVSFALNAQALLDIENASGGFFSIGGDLQGDSPGFIYIFGQTEVGDTVQRLVLTVNDIAEPGTIGILAAGFVGLGWVQRRKARR